MPNERILAHFQSPKNAGDLPEASSSADVSNPVCGDVLRLALRIEAGRIAEARFKAQGCVASIAAGSVMTEMLRGKTPAEAAKIRPEDISRELGELPQASFHAAQLCVDAIAAVLLRLK